MRTILLIVAALLMQFSAAAQGIATTTLHHGDEFKTFYSGTALRKALAEAQPVDIINLSAGLGSDGTQVGIYGTSLPLSVKTSYPQITKFKVAPESTSDGKLKIEIEIDANN